MSNKIIRTIALACLPFIVQAQNTLHNSGATFFINTGAELQINGAIKNEAGSQWQNEGTVHVTEGFVNDQIMPTPTSGTTRFEGSMMQIVSGAQPLQTYDVIFDNASGITLHTNLNVSHLAFFNNGIVHEGPTNQVVVFGSGANLGNTASDASHVNARVSYNGTGSFTYPVGDGIRYQPIIINLTSNADGMTVKYHAADAGPGSFTTTGTEATPLVAYNANEYWDILENGATGTVTMYWDDYNNTGITDVAHLKVAHKAGSDWLNEGTVATGTTLSGSVTSNTISSWSPFTLGSMNINSPLPITLLSFIAKNEANANVLYWTTIQEYNNAHFNVQRSTNAKDFVTIGKVNTKATNGNSSVHINYQLIDNHPQIGHHYYRLQQVDLDGKSKFSQTIKLFREAKESIINIYPNPTFSMLNVEYRNLDDEAIRITLSDLSGKILKEISSNHNITEIDLSEIAGGIYVVHVIKNQQIISTQKIEKK